MQSLYVNVFSTDMGGLCCRGTRVSDQTTIIRRNDPESSPIGKLLIFVNPSSGIGRGVKTFHSKVEPRLKKNNIDYELVITTGPNHARSIVSTRTDLNKFNGIIILSGDGLVFEVVNGICSRKDAYLLVSRLPIGIVPSGSGNGLLSSVFAANSLSLKDSYFASHAIDIVTGPRPEAQPINLLHVQTETQNMAAFLSVGWGIMADIDIESERWRSTLGSNRFVLTAIIRAMKLRSYRGRLSYKPYSPTTSHCPGTSFDVYGSTQQDMIPLKDCSSSSTTSQRKDDELWHCSHTNEVPSLEGDLPDDWVTMEEDFVGVYACSLSHISRTGHFMPRAKLDDDRIYLTYVLRKDVKSKLQMVNFLSGIDNGTHLDLSCTKQVEVSSFRLTPEDPKSLLVVDGEVIDCTRLQTTTTSMKTAVFT